MRTNTPTHTHGLLAALALLPLCLVASSAGAAQPRIVFHEIVNPGAGKLVSSLGSYPVMSGNGNVVVYSVSRADSQLDLFGINTDGTGQHSLGLFPHSSYRPAISYNGALAALWSNNYLYTLNTTSDTPVNVLTMTTPGAISSIAVNDDGTKVYFTITVDDLILNTLTTLQAGVWEMNPDGSGRRLVTGLSAMQAAVPAYSPHGYERIGAYEGLSISQNNRIVFSFVLNYGTGDNRIMGVNADGSGLHAIGPLVYSPNSVTISRDGSRVAYDQYSPKNVNTVGWDGTGHVIQVVPGHGSNDPLRLTDNGSHLALVDRLLRSDGGTFRSLRSGTSGSVLADTLDAPYLQVSADGRKICAVRNFGSTSSVMIVELDPVTLRGAPDIANTAMTPYYAVQNNVTPTTATAQVAYFGTPNGAFGGVYVWARLFQDGLPDQNDHAGDGGLYDDGTNGDAVSGNGLFTQNQFYYNYTASALGPRVVRFVAENIVSGLRHATMVDHEPFFVLASAPAGSAPVITSITPNPGTAGGTITIDGSNFGITRTGNVVTLGGYSCYVLTANGAGTQITVEVPGWFADGDYAVVVSANGQGSAPFAWHLGAPALIPDIDLGQTTLAFGNLATGTTSDQSVFVSNTGTGDLVISAVSSSNARFTHVTPALPLTIPAGQFSQLFIRFSPLAAGAQNGTLTITSNDPDESSVQVSVSGTGTGASLPELVTLAATGFTGTAPTLNGTVNANGTNVTVSFEYGLSTAYGSSVPAVPSTVSGSSVTAVSAALSGLMPNTVYHCRVTGVVGVTAYHGGDVTFATGSSAGSTQFIHFDQFAMGVQSSNFLAAYGIPSVNASGSGPGAGAPRINDHTFTNSTIPSSPNVLEQQALSNDPNQEHILTFNFSPVLAAFSMDRVGKHSGGSTDTWHADFYNAAGTLIGSVGESTPVVNAPVQRFGFTAPAGQMIARMDLVSVWTGFATHRNIPVDNFLLEPTLSPGGDWRRTWFGTSSNTGAAADGADPDHDGVVNLMEFAANSNPLAAGVNPGEFMNIGGVWRFVYYRTKQAMLDGVTFTVQTSGDLSPASWGSSGVTEEILFENAIYQEVRASLPAAANRQFARLRVSR